MPEAQRPRRLGRSGSARVIWTEAIGTKLLFRFRRQDDGGGRRRGNDLHRRETGLAQPGPIIRLPVGEALFGRQKHLGRKQHRKGMPGAVIIKNKIVHDERTAGSECIAKFAEHRDVV